MQAINLLDRDEPGCDELTPLADDGCPHGDLAALWVDLGGSD
jgi:hypothetical protein